MILPSTIRPGDRSTDVARWQSILGIVADGSYGPKTEAATRLWQARHGLTADGVVGPATWGMALATAAPAVTDRVQFIDVSSVQRRAVDAKATKAAGFDAMIVKAAEGNTGRDSAFRDLCKAGLDAGQLVGPYAFARPSADDQDPIRELENLYGACIDMGLQIRPTLDLESTKLAGKATLEWVTTWVWLAFKYWGAWPIIYTGTPFWKALGAEAGAATWATNCPIWIAQYNVDYTKSPAAARAYEPPVGAGPKFPAPWESWDAWQYSGTGGKRVPGVSVDCDRNVFRGTLADFRARMLLPATHG